MLSFFKKNAWFIFGLFVLVLVVLVNLFPKGYVLVGGDTPQFIEASSNLKKLFFEWNSSAILFYSIFYFLHKIGISNTGQLSFYFGIFILGSYISFYLFLKLIFNQASNSVKTISSLIYSLNLYTLYVFTYAWGYSHYQSLYIFIPLLIGLFIKFLQEKKIIYGILFTLVLITSSSGFANPAFALSFGILLLILTTTLIFLKIITFDRQLIFNVIFLLLFSLLANMYWILPIIPKMKSGVDSLFSGNAIDFNWWLRHSSNPIIDTFRLSQGNTWYFPNNFPYKKILWTKSFFIFLTIIPSLLFAFSFFYFKKMDLKNKRFFIVFSVLLLALVMLVAKVRPPFEVVNHYFYNAWGFNTLRGYEKFAIFTPFIFSIIIFFFLQYIYNKNLKKIFSIISFLILVSSLPFFIGGIQTKLCARFYANSIEKKDYKKADFSYLVKIPAEYYKIREIINYNHKDKFFIGVLPYGNPEGAGWTTYPKWKLTGTDITHWLYRADFISPYTEYYGKESFAKKFEEDNSTDSSWVVKILGMMNTQYILYHKDAPVDSVMNSKYKMESLETKGLIKNLESNDYFTLYEISSDLIFPYIAYQKESLEIRTDPVWIERNFQNLKNASYRADFKEINPKKFEINFENSKFSNNIILAEVFNPNWKAYAVGKNGKEVEIKEHFLARGYANGWRISNPENIEKIIIEYYPTRLMWRGIWISGATVLFLLIYLIRYYCIRGKKTNVIPSVA